MCSGIAMILYAEEEAAEVKKSKLYRPVTKVVPAPQQVSPVSVVSADSKKSVSLYSLYVALPLIVVIVQTVNFNNSHDGNVCVFD